ncbi:uncharacterized protein LOC107981899 isoform X2 [Nasonia vitripennis]|uniref:Uncharacterized protein n=1 Tax=Nasonia vitripennis TaxID=7425 RepID=A0A7M7R1V5_NASVI|nr:uncharacterized protein LOC107981899 isoform X2 [Nasonia vitripennis]XP_032457904.1 uncharacterized protein LOC107981899 isoform X2 [Nasonia vitripennis]XP_032457905.1 uncharacterized protein LOC107981899 isoform X2 [Nasonia vitripennis]
MLEQAQGQISQSTSDDKTIDQNSADSDYVPEDNNNEAYKENSRRNPVKTIVSNNLRWKINEEGEPEGNRTQVKEKDDSDDEFEDEVAAKKIKKDQKIAWSTQERKAVSDYITKYGIPDKVSTAFMNSMKNEYPILNGRDNMKLRAYIHSNRLAKKKKNN